MNAGPTNPTAGDGAAVHPELLGAYVTGLLDTDDRAALEEHLRGCRACRAEVEQMTRVRESFDAVTPEAVLGELERLVPDAGRAASAAVAPAPASAARADDEHDWSLADWQALTRLVVDDDGDPNADPLLARTLSSLRAEAAAPRRRRVPPLALAASVLLLALLAGVTGALLGIASRPGDSPPVVAVAGTRLLQATDSATGVTLTARITPARAWTRLGVTVAGVPAGTTCRIVAIARDGTQEVAGSWVTATPNAPGATPVEVGGSTAIAPADLAMIEIVDGTGRRLVDLRT